MKFDRWKSPWARTWAYTIFKKHHTQLNDMWWSYHCASRRASSIAHSVGLDSPAIKAFPAATNMGREQVSLSDWYVHFREFDNWVRLSNAMALCAYFEVYLATVTNLALRSDPAILLNSPKAVDGVSLLKGNMLPDYKDKITSITKGDWSARIHAYKTCFAEVPKELENEISELDQLRILRNGVGHAFGRELDDYESPLVFMPVPLQRLSETRLKKWLGIVEKAVNSIEMHLREKHIGAFEVFETYHAWDRKYDIGRQNEHGALRELFPHANSVPPSAHYFKAAITYYRSL